MAALIVLALLWPTQLLTLIALVGGSAQAQIAMHFHTTQIAWFALATGVVGTLVTPYVMKAADIFGRRTVMIAITVLGLIGDVIAAVAPTFGVMIAGRAIAGFYAPISILAYAAIRELFPPKQAATASSIVASGVGLVAIGGPFLSGWLLDDFGFRGALWSFVIATAIGLLLLIFFMPSTPPIARTDVHMDWIGGLLLGGSVTAITYGVGKGSDWGWTSTGTLAFMVGGALGLVVFVISQARVAHPMVPLGMLKRRPVWSVFLTTAAALGVLSAVGPILQLLPLYPDIPGVSDGLGFSVTHNAVIGLPANILMLATGAATGFAVRRIDSRLPLRAGLVVAAIGLLLLASYHYSAAQLAVVSMVFSVGYGMVISTVYVMIMEAVEPEEQGIANMVQGLVLGIIASVAIAASYAILARDGTVVQGTQFYLDQGYVNVFRWAAVALLLVLLTTFLVPRLRPVAQMDAGPPTEE
ncbi:MFS transporter [Yinghuangia soli]|uniref:MFS transporter n=1 Tax=Yinghuangia soli TaxID=2908204 RepID=A0AA41Q3Z2_9ACTN|nr:MFS transporter [Yinghuangia soli]MCF2531109.1 MFS transporter [Yinghuangia soli]